MGWQDEAREAWSRQTEGDLFKVKPDSTVVLRILPNKKGREKAPYFSYRVHRNVGPNNKMVRCGYSLTGEGSCWLCDETVPKLAESPKKEKQELAKRLAPREQMIMQVATFDERTEKFKGPFLYYVPTGRKTLSTMFLGLLGNAKKKSFDDPEKGYNITVTRAGDKLDTVYAPLDIAEEPTVVPKKILDLLKLFAELAPKYSEEKQKAIYFNREEEQAAADDEDDEEEEKPKSKKRPAEDDEDEDEDEAPKNKKKPSDDEDDEDEDVSDSEDEEEESDEEEEEESDGDDEEEDEKEEEESDEEEDVEPDPDDEDEEEAPVAKKGKAKPVAKAKPAKAASKKPAAKKRSRSDEDDE